MDSVALKNTIVQQDTAAIDTAQRQDSAANEISATAAPLAFMPSSSFRSSDMFGANLSAAAAVAITLDGSRVSQYKTQKSTGELMTARQVKATTWVPNGFVNILLIYAASFWIVAIAALDIFSR